EQDVKDFKNIYGGTYPAFPKASSQFGFYLQNFSEIISATPSFAIVLPDTTVVYGRTGFYDQNMRNVLIDAGFTTTTSSVDNPSMVSSLNLSLYPNPVNGVASLSFNLAEAADDVTVEVYD